MSGPIKEIAAFLRNDVQSRTAADVMAANPGKYDTEAQVGPHNYKSLLELLVGNDENHGGDPNFLTTHVIEKYGAGLTEADSGIELAYTEGESAFGAEGDLSDDIGVKICFVRILCRLQTPVDPNTQLDTADVLSARVEYILDFLLRGYFRGGGILNSPVLDVTVDPSLDKEYGVKCQYVRDLSEGSAIEKQTLWRVQYKTDFSK